MDPMKKYIVYLRTGADMDLDGQVAKVGAYLRTRGAEMVQDYVEVESGYKEEWPQLREAFRLAELLKIPVLVGAFPQGRKLQETLLSMGGEFTCADRPDVCEMTLGAMMEEGLTQAEYVPKEKRTPSKAEPLPNGREIAKQKREAAKKRRAQKKAERYRPLLEEAFSLDCRTSGSIAKLFTEQEVPTVTGKSTTWHKAQVSRLLDTLEMREEAQT